MDNNIDNEMEGFEEQIADNMKYSLDDEDVTRRRSFLDFTSQQKPLILGGIGVLLLIVLIALFFGGGDTLSKKDLASFKARLDQLEDRLTRFEGERAGTIYGRGRYIQKAFNTTVCCTEPKT